MAKVNKDFAKGIGQGMWTGAKMAGPIYAQYGAGYLTGKVITKKTGTPQDYNLKRGNRAMKASTGVVAYGSTYLQFTKAGSRRSVQHGVTASRFAAGAYAGRVGQHKKNLRSNDEAWQTRKRKYGPSGQKRNRVR